MLRLREMINVWCGEATQHPDWITTQCIETSHCTPGICIIIVSMKDLKRNKIFVVFGTISSRLTCLIRVSEEGKE
jgi:hypothetical protein